MKSSTLLTCPIILERSAASEGSGWKTFFKPPDWPFNDSIQPPFTWLFNAASERE